MSEIKWPTIVRNPEPKKVKSPKKMTIRKGTNYFANVWGVSTTTIWRWTKLKKDPLPSNKAGKLILIPVDEAEGWFNKRWGNKNE